MQARAYQVQFCRIIWWLLWVLNRKATYSDSAGIHWCNQRSITNRNYFRNSRSRYSIDIHDHSTGNCTQILILTDIASHSMSADTCTRGHSTNTSELDCDNTPPIAGTQSLESSQTSWGIMSDRPVLKVKGHRVRGRTTEVATRCLMAKGHCHPSWGQSANYLQGIVIIPLWNEPRFNIWNDGSRSLWTMCFGVCERRQFVSMNDLTSDVWKYVGYLFFCEGCHFIKSIFLFLLLFYADPVLRTILVIPMWLNTW